MTSLYAWSKSAGSNGNSDSAIAWPEGQTPGSVNNSARAVMGRVAEFRDDISGALLASGTPNGIVVTANSAFTTLANGRIVAFRASASNTTAVNINVNSLGAKPVRILTEDGETALSGGEIQSGGTYLVVYNESLNSAAGAWQLLNPSLGTSAHVGTDEIVGVATYTQAGTGAVARTVQARLRERVSVLDYRSPSDTTWTDTFDKAITYLKSLGGGRLHIPAGTYDMDETWLIQPTTFWHNLIIEGDGADTVLDFSGATAGSDGLVIDFNSGIHGRLTLQDLTVTGAPRHGIYLNRTASGSFLNRYSIRNVISDGNGTHGIVAVDTYMGEWEGVESRNNGGNGFQIIGYHTSLHFSRCWAGGDAAGPNGGNTLAGWDLSGLTYSTFNACSADWNVLFGWRFKNCIGVTLTGCAAERNGQEGWLVDTSGGAVAGLQLDGCLSAYNSSSSAGGYAVHLGAVSAGGHGATISMRGNYSLKSDVADVSFVLNGASGSIELNEKFSSFDGPFSLTGDVRRVNEGIIGKRAVAGLSGNQTVTNITDTTVALAVFDANTMGATLNSNKIVIPEGVNRVKLTAGSYWDTSSTGARSMRFEVNGSAVVGHPQCKVLSDGFTSLFLDTAVFEVEEGDEMELIVYQASGGDLDLIDNSSTFLAVEVLG